MHLKENASMYQILYYTEKENIELELLEKISKLPRLAENTKILRKEKNEDWDGLLESKTKFTYTDLRARKTRIQISTLT